MSARNPRRAARPRALGAGAAGALLGAFGGVLVGESLHGGQGALLGLAGGALVFAAGEALTDLRRAPATAKPAAWRVFGAVFFAAAFGGAVELAFGAVSAVAFGLALGLIVGVVGTVGLLSFRSNRIVLGVGCGFAIGAAAEVLGGMLLGRSLVDEPAFEQAPLAIVGGAIALAYRLIGAAWFRGADVVEWLGERITPEQAAFVVPFEAKSKRVGAEYFRELARDADGAFKRNAPGIGIVETMDTLRGPTFDPAAVDPLIREFYEHTSRFVLHIRPEWRRRAQPFFLAFKRGVASRIGQANLPFDIEEAQAGVVSYIDTIDFSADGIVDLRGWVRAYEASGEAIYVGVYTTFRHDGVGFVSVGFPLPRANFTATLRPYNVDGGAFLLRSHDTGHDYTGHYLSAIEDGALTVLRVPSFAEEIEVFVNAGGLGTEHRFSVSGFNFLTLHYTIERAAVAAED